jgi:glycosyltransferase involved in cell wall biosynthesis
MQIDVVNPLITIAIPTYQRLNYLKAAVESAMVQTYENTEILIGQDPTPLGLDPGILDWCQRLAQEQPKVRYQSNHHNLGLAGNWNALADAARGDYIVIIGDDDILLPTFIETFMKSVQPNIDVLFSDHYVIDSQGERLLSTTEQWTKAYHRSNLSPGGLTTPEICAWQNAIPMSTSLIRTSEVQRFRFKEDLNNPEIEFFIRLAQAGGSFVFVPDRLAEYRLHEQSATSLGRGLRSHRLVSYLLPLGVNPEIEPYKQSLLSTLMVNAVSNFLLDNEKARAGELLKSKYYPSNIFSLIKWIVQKLCIILPGNTGVDLYRMIHNAKAG